MKARAKGKRGEYEVRDLCQEVADRVLGAGTVEVKRNITQSRGGGADLEGIPWLALEVKYHEAEQLTKWWEQAKRQAKPGQEPVLAWRANHRPWRVRMYGFLCIPETQDRVRTPVDISIEAFLAYLENRISIDSAFGDQSPVR